MPGELEQSHDTYNREELQNVSILHVGYDLLQHQVATVNKLNFALMEFSAPCCVDAHKKLNVAM